MEPVLVITLIAGAVALIAFDSPRRWIFAALAAIVALLFRAKAPPPVVPPKAPPPPEAPDATDVINRPPPEPDGSPAERWRDL